MTLYWNLAAIAEQVAGIFNHLPISLMIRAPLERFVFLIPPCCLFNGYNKDSRKSFFFFFQKELLIVNKNSWLIGDVNEIKF